MKMKPFLLLLLLLWTGVIAGSLVFNLGIAENSVNQIVLNVGRSFFQEIETTRLWNARHGGVYVPITEKTVPNPYLEGPDRDIVTTSGRRLTMVNPAFMTRQIAAIADVNSSVKYHITSLEPIRPANAADRWETRALHDFESGAREAFEFFQAAHVYKYMAPLPVKAACLKCHAVHGYRLDDIRGGISVTIPATSYLAANNAFKRNLWLIHALALVLGGAGCWIFIFFQGRHTQEQIRLREEMQAEKTRLLDRHNRELEARVKARTYELQTMREKLFVTLQSIGEGVVTTDIAGRVTFINAIVEKLTGRKRAEALDHSLETVFPLIDTARGEPCDSPIDRILASGEIIDLVDNASLVTRDGRRIEIEYSGAPIFYKQTEVIGVVLIVRDVTEKHRTQAELLKVKKLKSVGVLAGGIAHDFNNILTAILGNINLAGMYLEPDHKAAPLLEKAERASHRARELTQQLLTFSKGGDPVRRAAAVDTVITHATDTVLKGGPLVCTYDLPEDLWQAEIDPGQIGQVIQNVVLNAHQAMPDGGSLEIAAANLPGPEAAGLNLPPQDHLRITIRDRGVGIAPRHLERIFDPYFTTKQKGSGLGLAITHSIVSKHQGHIEVQSELGVGTTVTVYLPAIRRTDDAAADGPAGAEEAQSPPAETYRILVMDDEAFVRDIARQMLAHLGHEVLLADEGRQAIAVYKEHLDKSVPIDLVIMDLTIPGGMGGKEAIRQLLKLDPRAKVIVASGYSNDPVLTDYERFGFRAAICKPFNLEELSAALERVL